MKKNILLLSLLAFGIPLCAMEGFVPYYEMEKLSTGELLEKLQECHKKHYAYRDQELKFCGDSRAIFSSFAKAELSSVKEMEDWSKCSDTAWELSRGYYKLLNCDAIQKELTKKQERELRELEEAIKQKASMEDPNPTPGQAALKKYPNAWLATKIAGGATGSLIGFSIPAVFMAFGDIMLTVASRGISPARQKLQALKMIAITSPFIYGGWKGGQALSEAVWHPAWNAADRVKKIIDDIKKNDKC